MKKLNRPICAPRARLWASTKAVLAAVLILSSCRLAQAQFVINFDVPGGESGGRNYIGQGAYADSTNNYWNPIKANGTTPAGTNSDGVTVSAITFTEAQTGSYNDGGPGTQGAPTGLQTYFADATGSATSTCALKHVATGNYSLYLYGINGGTGDSDRGTTFTVSSDLTSAISLSTVNSKSGATAFIQGNDYVVFNNVIVGAGAAITFTYTHTPAATDMAGNTEGDFNGVQLIQVSTGTNPVLAAPIITTQPSPVSLSAGGSAQLTVVALGTDR